MKRIITVVILLGGTLVCSLNAAESAGKTNTAAELQPLKPGSLFTNIIAKGKGVSVTRSLLDEALVSVKASAAARRQNIPPEYMKMYERELLQQIIQMQILNSVATEADKAAGKTTVTQRMDELKQNATSEEALDKQLKSVGLTRSELIAKMTEAAVAEEVVKRELKTTVATDDIKKFYEENPARFEQPEMVRVSHILMSTKDPGDPNPDPSEKRDLPEDKKEAKRKQIDDLLKRARAGEDFSKLAKEFSEDPGIKVGSGEYTFSRDDRFAPEFKAAAFTLNTGQISDPVTTVFGYHIIKLIEKTPAQKADLEDEVVFSPSGYVILKKSWKGPQEPMRNAAKLSQVIRQKLENDQRQKQAPAFLEKLVKDADVQILEEDLKAPPQPPAGAMPPGMTPK